MRFILAVTCLSLLAATPVLAQDVTSDNEKVSYAVGWDMGTNIKRRVGELDVDTIIQAIRDAVNESEPRVSQEEMQQILIALQQQMRQEQLEALRKLAEENKAKSEAFLAENRGKTGIVALPSGVQYRVIEEGDGQRPSLEDTVRVHYRGSKMDGREFDSSFARGTPEEFTVNAVLRGWQEVLPLMKEGSTWQVFVPPELAFGTRGQPPVGPNEALMFDLKLIEIVR